MPEIFPWRNLQSVYKRSLGLEAMHSAFGDLVQEVIERNAKDKYLKNLHTGQRGTKGSMNGTYRIHITQVARIYKTAGLKKRELLLGVD
jgi:hypothetical protein